MFYKRFQILLFILILSFSLYGQSNFENNLILEINVTGNINIDEDDFEVDYSGVEPFETGEDYVARRMKESRDEENPYAEPAEPTFVPKPWSPPGLAATPRGVERQLQPPARVKEQGRDWDCTNLLR